MKSFPPPPVGAFRMPLAERARTKLGNIQILIYIVEDIRRRHSLKTFVEDISSNYEIGIT